MKKVVENVYLSMYKNYVHVTFLEKLIVCILTFVVLFGIILTLLTII
jgi:hypothetical protein